MSKKSPYVTSPLGAFAQRFCRPLYKDNTFGGKIAYATCTFITFLGKKYILQCHHSLIEGSKKRIPIQYVLIDNDFITVPAPFLENEKYDYAVSSISDEISDAITTLKFANILEKTLYEPVYTFVIGYPATRMKDYHKTKVYEQKIEGIHPITNNPMSNAGKYFGFATKIDIKKRTDNEGWFTSHGDFLN